MEFGIYSVGDRKKGQGIRKNERRFKGHASERSRSCEQRSHQQQHISSLGQKVSEPFKGHHHHNNSNNLNSSTQCRRKQPRKRKNVFQKIKDGLSGHSSDSSSSISDHENCHKRKN